MNETVSSEPQSPVIDKRSWIVLTMNTLAFVVCFACWMLYGVLITFLVDNGIYLWNTGQMGLLIGTPVLTGALLRLPVGLLTDKYGGRNVFALLMLTAALGMFMVSRCNTFTEFLLAGLVFGLSGAGFAVGVAYTSIWFPPQRQGLALGIFGAGNAGAAITSFGAPKLLAILTANMQNLEGWRTLPQIYAAVLAAMAVIFWLCTFPKKVEGRKGATLAARLAPLKNIRVWRFGLYYFFVFGGFVALSQWLIPYYLNVYGMTLALAGTMAAMFSLPSGIIRALGGWLSDKFGARNVMYAVFIACLLCTLCLSVPRMDIQSPGPGVMASKSGTVTAVTAEAITVGEQTYKLRAKDTEDIITIADRDVGTLVYPTFTSWHEPQVKVGDVVQKKQVLARGVTHIFFQANVWVFSSLVFIMALMMGIGNAAVFRYIPDYFPKDVGVVGGIVGVIGGLGGFFGPILFGYLLDATGIWTTCWMFFTVLIGVCLAWMHWTISHMMNERAPDIAQKFEKGAVTITSG